jgi:hypothetical protein
MASEHHGEDFITNVASPDRVATAAATSIPHSRGEDAEDWHLVGTYLEVRVVDTEGLQEREPGVLTDGFGGTGSKASVSLELVSGER